MKTKSEYPRIAELGLTIYNLPVAHIKPIELKKKLTKKEYSEFNKLFGSQTCPIVNGKCGLFPWDTEAVLERIISGKLTGSQKYWD